MIDSSFSPTTSALLATMLVSLAPNLILFLFPNYGKEGIKGSNVLSMGQAVAAGGLLGDVFLHTLPHAMEAGSHGEGGGPDVGQSVILGFCCFLILDGIIRSVESHDHGHSHDHGNGTNGHANGVGNGHGNGHANGVSNGHGNGHANGVSNGHANGHHHDALATKKSFMSTVVLNLAADALHNFTDGLAIGVSYAGNAAQLQGAFATLSVILHEIPHELGDYSILVSSGFSKREAITAQFSTAIAAMFGTLVGLYLPARFGLDGALLSFTSGGFVYLAACTILPDLLQKEGFGWRSRLGQLLAFLVGVAFMQAVAVMEHSMEGHGHDHGHHVHDYHDHGHHEHGHHDHGHAHLHEL